MKNLYAGAFWLLMLVLAGGAAQAQDEEATLKLYIVPPAEAVAIDEEILPSGNVAQLSPGSHRLRLWRPGYVLLDTVLEMQAGEERDFVYYFNIDPEYKKHLAEMTEYNEEFHPKVLYPAVATTLSAGALAFIYFKGSSLADQAWALEEEYRLAGFEVGQHRSDFEEMRSRYQLYYNLQYVAYAALAVSAYYLYRGWRWSVKNPAPEYDPGANPIRLQEVGLRHQGISPYPGLCLTFSLDGR